MDRTWRCREPDLESLLAEPIVCRLMARDGVTPDMVRALMKRIMRRT